MSPLAVYVHIPFCPSKCGYCDFNSFALEGEIVDRTVRAIIQEILTSPHRGRPAKTVFFGGGTPTFLSAAQLGEILHAVTEVHPPVASCEITSEANPGTVDAEKFRGMRAAGFNRLSLGAQSFHPGDLMRLGRVHQAHEVGLAVKAGREAGFDNLNLDLMFALPGQSPKAWQHNLDLALSLKPDHLSLYCLTIESNTRFNRLNQRGMLHLPDDELQTQMYEQACESMAQAGLQQYEISNFGRPCEHNLCYWRAEEYAGYGPGAVGRVGMLRTTKMKHPERYCEAVETGGELCCDQEVLTEEMLQREMLMLGLRLNSGIDPRAVEHDATRLNQMVDKGWLTATPECIALTPAGRHFCNEVIVELMP